MVGGMLTAVLLTLYVIPLCYYLLEKYRAARRPGAGAGN
jgi:Cu/Ag efflux pump CusA